MPTGKSTLFNRLTGAEVFAKDLLFATLDPTLRLLRLPSGMKIILSDTVGFISDLPTHLVAAFRATLEEVVGADAILHVHDISHEGWETQANDVAEVLARLDIDIKSSRHVIDVWNKAICCRKMKGRLFRKPPGAASRTSGRWFNRPLQGRGWKNCWPVSTTGWH